MHLQEKSTRIVAWISFIVIGILLLFGLVANLTGHASFGYLLFNVIQIIVGMLFLCGGLFLDTWFGRNFMGLQTSKGIFNRSLFIICGFIMMLTGVLFLVNHHF